MVSTIMKPESPVPGVGPIPDIGVRERLVVVTPADRVMAKRVG